MLTRRRVRRASQRLRERAEQQRRQHHQDDRRRDPRRRRRLRVHPRRGLLVEPLRVGQDRLLHQRRRLGQVRRADRIARPVVGARGLDQPGVHREVGVDPAEQLHHRLVGQPARRPGHRAGGVGDRLLVALPDVARLGARDEGRGRGGVGDRERGVELPGRERQRLGVVEDGGQRLLAVVDGGRRGERAGDHQRGQHDADGQDPARAWSTETTSAGARVLSATATRVARSTGAPTPQSRVPGLHHIRRAFRLSFRPASIIYKRILRVIRVTCGHSRPTGLPRVP